MRVTKLELLNFRGMTRKYELPAALIVAGPNFSGKSTIPIALRLACVGSLPAPIGKAGIWPALAGNADEPGKMSVTATTDTGLSWSLEWEKKKESVSQRGQPPAGCALPPVLCDPATFWTMTGAEQSRAIFAASGAKIGLDDLLAEIRSVDGSPVRIRNEVVESLETLMRKRWDANAEPSSAVALWTSDCGQIAKDERAKSKRLEAKAASCLWTGPIPADQTKALQEARDKCAEAKQREHSLNERANLAALSAQKAERVRRRLAELESVLRAPQEPEPPELTEQEAELQARAAQTLEATADETARAQNRWDRARNNLELLRSGTCPCCGQSGPALSEVVARLEAELADARAECAAMAERMQQDRTEVFTVTKRNQAKQEARAEWLRKQDAIEALRQEHARLAECVPDVVTPPTADETDALRAESGRLRDRVSELEGAQGEFARWAAIMSERDKAESDLVRSRCVADVAMEAARKVSAKLDEVANVAFAETLKIANRLCDGLLASPLEFRDGVLGRKASKEDAARTSGAVKQGAWIPHTSFSGTEALIGYAGFAVAVASKAPFRLVVMDELNRLTADRKRSLVSRILLLIGEGVIDQFVGCDPEASETFTLIDAARWDF